MVNTKKLNDGTTVLAHPHGGAVIYANVTQAKNRAAKLVEKGIAAKVIGHRPFYVAIADS